MLGSVIDHIDMVECLEFDSTSAALELDNAGHRDAWVAENSCSCMDSAGAKVAAVVASADCTACHTLTACESIAWAQAKVGTTSHAESPQTCRIQLAVGASSWLDLVVDSTLSWPMNWHPDRCIVDSLLASFGADN